MQKVIFNPESIRSFVLKNIIYDSIKQCEFAINKSRGAYEFFIRNKKDERYGGAILYDKKIFKKNKKALIDVSAIKQLIFSILLSQASSFPNTTKKEKQILNKKLDKIKLKLNKILV